MSGTALERAAEALCLAQSGVSCYHDLEPEAQESAREHVRTVLLAVREPSAGMIEAACGLWWLDFIGDEETKLTVTSAQASQVFQTMLDAALSE